MEFVKKPSRASKFVISLSNILRVRKWTHPLIRLALQTPLGRSVTLALLSIDSELLDAERPYLIRGIIKALCANPNLEKAMVKAAQRRYRAHRNTPNLEIYVLFLLAAHQYPALLEMLNAPETAPYIKSPIMQHAHRYAMFETGNFKNVCDNSMHLTQAEHGTPLRHLSVINTDFLRAAYASGMSLDKTLAIWYFAHQYSLASDDNILNDAEINHIKHVLCRQFTSDQGPAFLHAAISGEKIGVFLLHAPQALGHAILDPYHYLSLYRERYDRIYFIGGDLGSYSMGSRACVEIVKQYGEYLPTSNDLMFNLSWMSMGQLKFGNVEITVEHYWSLLREVSHRTASKDDDFALNAWHFDLPPRQQMAGERFCAEHHIDLNKPIITLHARDQGYHAIAKQGFRNSPIQDYVPAIEHLLKDGYQVVRLGDTKMPRLHIHAPGYFEIPNMDRYENGLDPFFIKHSLFMIGSQSGPCSYARALGVPVLSVNAVFSYTLLPAVREMACFKRYVDIDDNGHERYLDYDQLLDRNVFQMENLHQFEKLGLSFVNCTPAEITAAVQDMIAWVKQPDLPMTAEQEAFRQLTLKTAARVKDASDNSPPIADYLGIALPGYRISPTVEALRASSAC